MTRQWKKQSVVFFWVIITFSASAPFGFADLIDGTLINTPNGFKAIEQIKFGNTVLAGTITELPTTSWTNKPSLICGGSNCQATIYTIAYGNNQQLAVTADQIFFLLDGTLKNAVLLSVGETLLQADGNGATISEITESSYSGGLRQLAVVVGIMVNTDNTVNTDNHLLNANGVVVGDYVLQINYKASFNPNEGAFPPPDSPADYGTISIVAMESGAQQFPDVAYNSKDNNYLAVWENVKDDGVYEIQGVVLTGDAGAPISDPVLLLRDDNSVEAPEIAYNSKANEYLLVARRKNDNIVFAQRVSAQGQPVGAKVELTRSGGPTFFDAAARARVVSVAYNSKEDRYIVAYGEPMTVQIFMPDLTLEVTGENLGVGANPSISWSSKSNVYLLAYEDRQPRDTGSENLSAVLIDNIAEAAGEIISIRDQQFAEESPRVAYNPDDDQFLIVWDERIGFSENLNPQTLTDTIGQIVKTDGTLLGQPIKIEAGTAYTLRQDVDYNPTSQVYLVVWKGDPSGDFAFADIYGQFVNRDGSLNGDRFLIYDGGDDNVNWGNSEQYFDESKLPAVAANTQTGQFLVVWEESGTYQDPEMRDIMSRRVSLASTPVPDWPLYE